MPIRTGKGRAVVAVSAVVAVALVASVALVWRPWARDTRPVAPAGFVSSAPVVLASAPATVADAAEAVEDAALLAAAKRIALPASFSSSDTFFGKSCGEYPLMRCWANASSAQASAREIASAMIAAGMSESSTRCESACSVAVTAAQGTIVFIVAPSDGPGASGSATYETVVPSDYAAERAEAVVLLRQRVDVQIAARAVVAPSDFTPIDTFFVTPCLDLATWFACWSTPVSPKVAAEQMEQALAAAGLSASMSCGSEDGCDLNVSLPEGRLWIGVRRRPELAAEGYGPPSPGCEIFAAGISKLFDQMYGDGPSVPLPSSIGVR